MLRIIRTPMGIILAIIVCFSAFFLHDRFYMLKEKANASTEIYDVLKRMNGNKFQEAL